jgi:hypothetical protein
MKVGTEPKTPAQIDEVILDLVQRQGALDEELGRWLLLAQRARVHRHFGFAAFGDYVAARLGVTPRLAKERASVAEALEALPLLRRALVTGSRSWSAVRELSRVATPDTEAAWLQASEGKNLRALEGLVSGRRPGDGPEAPPDPLLAQHRAVFVQTSDQRATTVEALARARRILGPEATDGAVLAFMCEDFLGPKRNIEEGAGYQVSLTLCAECQSAHRTVAGEVLPVSDAVRGLRALCDPELVGLTPAERPEPFGDAGAARRTLPVGEAEGAEGRSTHVCQTEGAQGRSTHVGQAEGADGPSHEADSPEGAEAQSTHVGRAEGADGHLHEADPPEGAGAQSTHVDPPKRPGVQTTQGCLDHGAEAPLTHVGRSNRERAAFSPALRPRGFDRPPPPRRPRRGAEGDPAPWASTSTRSLPSFGAWSWPGITTAAWCPAARATSSSTSTTSGRPKTEGPTPPTT